MTTGFKFIDVEQKEQTTEELLNLTKSFYTQVSLYSDIKERTSKALAEYKDANEELIKIKERQSSLETVLASKQAQIDDVQRQINQTNDIVIINEQRYQRLKQEGDELQDQVVILKMQVSQLEQERNAHELVIQASELKQTQLQEAQDKMDASTAELKTSLALIKKEKEKTERIYEQISAKKAENDKLMKQIELNGTPAHVYLAKIQSILNKKSIKLDLLKELN